MFFKVFYRNQKRCEDRHSNNQPGERVRLEAERPFLVPQGPQRRSEKDCHVKKLPTYCNNKCQSIIGLSCKNLTKSQLFSKCQVYTWTGLIFRPIVYLFNLFLSQYRVKLILWKLYHIYVTNIWFLKPQQISIKVELNSLYQHLICTHHILEKKNLFHYQWFPIIFFNKK